MRKITVGGIGNVLLGDDGIGPYVAALLEENYRLPDYVEVIDFGTPSLELLAHIAGADAIILVDAAENAKPPGTITRYTREDVLRSDPAPRLDCHSPALAATLGAAELLGAGPANFLLIGITPEAVTDALTLSPSVLHAAHHAVEQVIKELQRIGVPVTPKRTVPSAARILYQFVQKPAL